LKDYLSGPQAAEIAWLSPERQQEEAWFLGLRLNGGVKLAALKREFGGDGMERALAVVRRLAESDLVVSDGKSVRLTARGRMVSNDVFQEFLFAAEPASDLEATAAI
jgi:oxygen-independent coproporphyrinogen-3 oxidase